MFRKLELHMVRLRRLDISARLTARSNQSVSQSNICQRSLTGSLSRNRLSRTIHAHKQIENDRIAPCGFAK
jgi:hypothetical protein